jgi:hypothetical protein
LKKRREGAYEKAQLLREVKTRTDDTGESAERSDGFFDQPGSQTASAHANAQGRTVHQCSHALQIGIKDASRLVVRVADVISGLMLFPTEITSKCHGPTPLLLRLSTTSLEWEGMLP